MTMLRNPILWLFLLFLPAQDAYPATELQLQPNLVELTAGPGSSANKARILRLTDGTLVTAWHEGTGPPAGAWDMFGNTYAPRDIFVRVSSDDGQTWSDAVNVSGTALLTDASALYDRHGDGSGLAAFYGDSGKPTLMAAGNDVLVMWEDAYCGNGLHGPATYESERGFLEVPFRCLYAARISVVGGSINPIATDRLTDASRDVKNAVARATGAGFALAWQEDPQGLQLGEARGEGDGASGARVSPGTDIWYAWISRGMFTNAAAPWQGPVPVSDNFDYAAATVTGGGASRPIMALAGSPPTAILVYEEAKNMGPEDAGKFVRFHEFRFNLPPAPEAGVVISTPDENSRRARVMAMSTPGKAHGTRMVLMWRQGDGIQGAPADVMIRTGSVPAGTDLAAVPNAGFRVTDLWPAVDPDEPANSEAALNITGARLDDPSTVDPAQNAKAHRAVMDGDHIYVGYTQDFDVDDGVDQYQYFIRHSPDGGANWAAPVQVSDGAPGSENVIEPRLLRTPGSGPSGAPYDIRNPDILVLAWGTALQTTDDSEPVRDALFVTRTVDRGASFERIQAIAATRTSAEQTDEQIQLRVTPDGQHVSAVWIRQGPGESDAVFATAVGITPTANLSLAIAAADAAPDVGDTVQVTLTVTNHGPHAATELTVQAVVEAGLIPDSVTADSGSCTTGAAFDCDLEDLAPGASAVIVGMFTAAERGSWLITAEASAWEEEPQPSDNQATLEIAAVPHADLSITVSADKSRVKAGRPFRIDFVLTNKGPQQATDILVTADIPANSEFLGSQECQVVFGKLSCLIDTLAVGETWTASAEYKATGRGSARIDVLATAPEPDPVAADNASAASIKVLDKGGGCVHEPGGDGGTLTAMLLLLLIRLWEKRSKQPAR